jgi:methylmalonyl-CoA mutase
VQTSGRSLHAREISFNDIRTTLQALYALFDNCNSLHTNAYDEALTTPTEESVRRAVAIQLVINRELGLNKIQNPWQGSFAIDYLTDMVEEAVYKEFEALSERGGVLGSMETMYQRGKIQDESLYYEEQKHSGAYPIVGINTFVDPEKAGKVDRAPELTRSLDAEKDDQIATLAQYRKLNAPEAARALDGVRDACRRKANIFEALMEAGKVCSLGQISATLYEMGGQYRRNM